MLLERLSTEENDVPLSLQLRWFNVRARKIQLHLPQYTERFDHRPVAGNSFNHIRQLIPLSQYGENLGKFVYRPNVEMNTYLGLRSKHVHSILCLGSRLVFYKSYILLNVIQ
jgi:hypothetical protein